ncbi:MAG: hypothetical protein L7S61_02345 [Acidimicrobiales bacterium]|nr:hypothetical protein [Acidimicrobiales bacterium]
MSSKRKLDNMLNVLRNYIRQETIEPIRSLFGSVIFLFIGSLAVSIGFIFISIGLVAFLREIDGMDTWFSWVPYLSGSLFLVCVVFLSIRSFIVRKSRDV